MTNTIQLKDIFLAYQDKEIEQLIDTRNQELQNQASQQGKKDGFANKPNKEESILTNTIPITAGYNLMNTEVNSKLNARNQLKYGQQDVEEAKFKHQALVLEKDVLDSQLKNLSQDEGAWPWSAIFKVGLAILLCSGLLIGEQEFIAKSLQVTSSGWLSNRLLAIGISTAILLVAHLSQKWISQIQNKWLRLIAILLEGLLIGSVFMALAIFRQSYFSQIGQTGMPLWAFILLNILFFYAFYLASTYILTPALQELKRRRELLKQAWAKKALQKKQKKVAQEIKDNKADLDKKSRLRIAVISYAKSTEERIQRLHEQAISIYIQSNREVRTEPLPDLNVSIPQLKTYYDKL